MAANICRGCNTSIAIEDRDFITMPEGGLLHAICATRSDHLIARGDYSAGMRSTHNITRLMPERQLSEEVKHFLKAYADAAENPDDLRDRQKLIQQLAEMDSISLKDGVLEVSGTLEIEQLAITGLPDKMRVNGDLCIEDCDNLRCLPDFLHVAEDFNLDSCSALQKFGERLMIGKDFNCTELQCLQALPSDLQIQGNFRIGQCSSLRTYLHPKVEGRVEIYSCAALKTIKYGFEFKSDLTVKYCPELVNLPEHLQVNGNCNLNDNYKLAVLPESMNVKGSLDLSRTAIRSFKTDLRLLGDLTLCECPKLASLQGKYEIPGNFSLTFNPLLSHLPDNLSVRGELDLENCTGLEALPVSMHLTGNLNLSGCSLIRKLPDWIFQLGRQAGQYTHVNIFNTGLSVETLIQLQSQSYEWLTFLNVEPDYQNASALSVHDGQELQPLIQRLRCAPAVSFHIQYENSFGVDQGGLSRQVFDRALHQLIQQVPDLFCAHEDQLVFQGQHEKTVNISAAADLGLLLGHIARLGMGIGQCFHDDFYRHLFHAYNQVRILSRDELKDYSGQSAALLSTGLPKESCIDLLKQHSADLYSSPDAGQYLQATEASEVRDYAFNTGLYMQVAAQIHRTGLDEVYDAALDFKTAIAGFDQLKAAFLNNLSFTCDNPSLESLSGRLENWTRRAISEASQQQLQCLCQEISGASSLGITGQPVTVHLGLLSYRQVMFEAQSCGYQLSVNDNLFEQLAQNNNFEDFKNVLLNSFTPLFNVD